MGNEERWLENAKTRGWHIQFRRDAVGRKRVRRWEEECERQGQPCILVVERGWEAVVKTRRKAAEPWNEWRMDAGGAPAFANGRARRLGAWEIHGATVDAGTAA